MNYEEIMARIQKGEKPEDIVKEFTDNMNKAQAEAKKAEEAKAKEDTKSKKKDEIAVAIAHALNEYITISGVEAEKLRGAEVRELLDQVIPVIDSLKNIKVHVAKTSPKIKERIKSADDAFDWLFKEMGW